MKRIRSSLVLSGLALMGWAFAGAAPVGAERGLPGAWHYQDGSIERVLLVVDGYWSYTLYDRAQPTFHRTFGGPYRMQNGVATGKLQFDSAEPARVGETLRVRVEVRGDSLHLEFDDGATESFRRMSAVATPLEGVWRISGRKVDGEMQAMPLRDRRTLKLLTGSRFQWIAINIATGEFSGTGGGTYTFKDGRYEETLEFFSRDSSRVGARLGFDGEVVDGQWVHRGLSSRGDPIHEVWTKLESAD